MNEQLIKNVSDDCELFLRRQSAVEIDQPEVHPLIVMEAFGQNPNILCPKGFLHFEKTKGDILNLNNGDQFSTHVFGPWNSSLKVVKSSIYDFKLEVLGTSLIPDTVSFRLLFEKGKWKFIAESVIKKEQGFFLRVISKLPMVRFGQDKMLKQMCQSFAKICCPKKIHILNPQGRTSKLT